MKRKIRGIVLLIMSLAGCLSGYKNANVYKGIYQEIVYAENSEGTELIKDINAAIEKTVNSEKLDVDIKVGSTTKEGYDIRRNFYEDKKNGIIHMVDTVYNTVKGPETNIEYWFDVDKEYRYEYNSLRKKYMFSTGENGDFEREYLNLEFYLDKISDDYIKNENTVTENDNVNIKVDGKNVKCRVFDNHSVYKYPKWNYSDDFNLTQNIEDSLTEDNSETDNLERVEADLYYYVGVEDGRIYQITDSRKREEEQVYLENIYYSYPEKDLNIPKKVRKKAQLLDNCFVESKGVIYVSMYKGKKTVLLAYDCASKKVFNSKKKLIIPKSVKVADRNYKITGIGTEAFAYMKKLNKVIIKADIESINSKAFYKCSRLKRIRINSKRLKKIKKNAFAKTKKITFAFPKSKIKKYRKLLKKSGIKKAKIRSIK